MNEGGGMNESIEEVAGRRGRGRGTEVPSGCWTSCSSSGTRTVATRQTWQSYGRQQTRSSPQRCWIAQDHRWGAADERRACRLGIEGKVPRRVSPVTGRGGECRSTGDPRDLGPYRAMWWSAIVRQTRANRSAPRQNPDRNPSSGRDLRGSRLRAFSTRQGVSSTST